MNGATSGTISGATNNVASIQREQPAQPRTMFRSIAIPSEHGGWGFTAEPVLLGLLLAPSVSGIFIGLCAFGLFLLRTPLKLVIIDRWRGNIADRTRLATALVAIESCVIATFIAISVIAGSTKFIPWAFAAAPFVLIEFAYDIRSRGRRLIPELAGVIGISFTAAAIVIAGNGSFGLALAALLVLAARNVTAVTHVRSQIKRLRNRPVNRWSVVAGDLVAMAFVSAAFVFERSVLPGVVAVAIIVLVQQRLRTRPVPQPKIIGMRQAMFGLLVVFITAVGVHIL